MEKEQSTKTDKNTSTDSKKNEEGLEKKEPEISPEDKIKELEEKIARTLAEM
tara:strand:+ start:32 stop:187 length:156 start_codon:yes stop_codon:yes gene_type:complete